MRKVKLQLMMMSGFHLTVQADRGCAAVAFFGGGEGGVWAKKGVTLRGLRISEKKEILRKPTVS